METNDDQPSTFGKRRVFIDSGSNLQSKKRLIDDTYAASGVKRALDGTIYQSKLLGLFIKRGLGKNYDFGLATEMDAAEKFDDVVFKYKESDQDEQWTWRFLQAKHKQDSENKLITINDLTSKSNDNPFSLQKYFISFCKINDNKLFEGANLKDFTICTNTGFNFKQNLKRKNDNLTKKDQEHNELIKKWEGFFEKEEDLKEDAILYFNIEDFKAEKFKFNDKAKTDLTKIIKYSLLSSALEIKNIKDISLNSVERIIQGEIKALDTTKLILEAENAVKVAEELKGKKGGLLKGKVDQVIIKVLKLKGHSSEGCHFDNLKDGNVDKKSDSGKINILENAKNILNRVKYNFEGERKLNLDKYEALKENKIKLNVIESDLKTTRDKIWDSNYIEGIIGEECNDLIKRITKTTLDEIQKKTDIDLKEVQEALDKKLEKTLSEVSIMKLALDIENFDNYLEKFLEKFRFVTNYPNEKELGSLISHELGKEFHLLDADLVRDSFEKEMLDFLKSYDKGKAKFYSCKDGKNFFTALKEKIDTLMTAGLGKAYPEKLRGYGVGFDENQKFFNNFDNHLVSFFTSKDKQILHVSSQLTRLSTIKVLQSCQGFYKYKNHDSYICVCLRTLFVQKIQEYVINSFSKQGSHDLLVIECQAKTQGNAAETAQLYSKLSSALNKSSKKIILIAQAEDHFVAKFKNNKYQKEDDRNSFEDLDKDSQDKVLKKKVDFQGKDISLSQLIDKTSASEIIDQVILSELIEEERIAIGDTSAFSSIGYLKDHYIERALHRQIIKIDVLKEENIGSDLLFITGINEDLNELEAQTENFYQWEDGQIYNKGIIFSSLRQTDQEIFQNLYETHPGKNIHWLEYQGGKLFWRDSKGKLSALNGHIDKDDVPQEKHCIKEEEFICPTALGNKVIIIANDAGVGKSTVLTSIARKMKGFDDSKKVKYTNVWIVRLDLNDYAFDKEKLRNHDTRRNIKSLKEISFKDDNIKAAIDFVSKMAVSGDPRDIHIQFQRKIFKTSLEKVVILFDGFDEISPTYKEKTYVLLKALKGSHLAQFWVTTRVHEKKDLEDLLESPAYLLNNLTADEQREFLNKFWRWSLKLRIQETYEKICEHQDESKHKYEYSQEQMTHQYLKQLKQLIETLPDSLFDTSIQYRKNEMAAILQKHTDQKKQAIGQLESLQTFIDEKDVKGNYKLDFYRFSNVLLEQWEASIIDTEKAFTNVPLNLRMLAEVVLAKKFQLPGNSGLLGLYEEFINIKLDIFKEEKAKAIPGNEAADDAYRVYSEKLSIIHCELAVEELFKEEESPTNQDKTIKALLSVQRKTEKFRLKYENANTQLQRPGLISFLSDGSPRFIHRSFAEYFFSIYLVRNLQKENKTEHVQKLLLEKILLEYNYALICKFLNGQLEKNPLLAVELTNTVKDSINESLKKIGVDTVLHKMAQQYHTNIIDFLINKLKKYPDILENLLLKTGKYGTSACYDILYNPQYLISPDLKIKIIKAFLEPLKDQCDIHTKIMTARYLDLNIACKGSSKGVTILQNAILRGCDDIVNFLLSIEENFKAMLLENGNEPEETIIHFWALYCPDKNRQTLLNGLYIALPRETEKIQTEAQADENRLEFLKKLVLKGDKHGQTALHLATANNRPKIVSSLLDWVMKNLGEQTLKDLVLAAPVLNYEKGATALYMAAKNGRIETFQALFDSLKGQTKILKEAILATDECGTNSLYAAAWNGKTKIVVWLLTWVKKNFGEQTLNELLKPDKFERTALHMAAARKHHETVVALLEGLKDQPKILEDLILPKNNQARSILHEAVHFKCNQTLHSLLDWMKVNLPGNFKELLLKCDKYGNTALHLAASEENSNIIQTFLDSANEDLDTLKTLVLVLDEYGRTALHKAKSTETVQTLLNELKKNLENNTLEDLVLKADIYGKTALHYLAWHGKTVTVQVLINWVEKHIDKENPHENFLRKLVQKSDNDGNTALDLAFQKGHIEIASLLTSHLLNIKK